jgi:hypothetical protein
METLDETSKSISSKMGFFKHVFNFDDDSKSEMLNIIQYSLIGIVPIVILNKLMQKYVPKADEQKSSMEISAEIIIQVIFVFLGILFINRIITYIPTYSGEKYPSFSVIYIVLSFLMITLSLQTKLGDKVSILYDRVVDLWEGKQDQKKGKKVTKVKVSQPIYQGGYNPNTPSMNPSANMNNAAMTQSLYDQGTGTTSISDLPSYQNTASSAQPPQDYNSMFQSNPTPMPGAATPGIEQMSGMAGGIMAANEALGGSSFGSKF